MKAKSETSATSGGSTAPLSPLEALREAGYVLGGGSTSARGPFISWTKQKPKPPKQKRARKRRGSKYDRVIGGVVFRFPPIRKDRRATSHAARAIVDALADGEWRNVREIRRECPGLTNGGAQPVLAELVRGGLVERADTFDPTHWHPPFWQWTPGRCRYRYRLTARGRCLAMLR